MTIEIPSIASQVLPGQFVHLKIPGFDSHILRRPFSVYSIDNATGTMDILYQVVGSGSEFMTTLLPGVSVDLIGPLGRGWQVPEGTQKALLVGGGVGAAPLFMLAQSLQQQGVSVKAVLGAQSKDTLVCEDRYTELLSSSVCYSTDDGSFGHDGFCTPLVEQALAEETFDYLACCGPEPLMKIVVNLVRDTGVCAEISLERRMACGIGACLSCVVETTVGMKRACIDGPVFEASKVVF